MLEHEAWVEREREAQVELRKKREWQEKVLREREERERLIREEWEALQQREKEEEEKRTKARKAKEERLKEALSVGNDPCQENRSGPWHNPLAPEDVTGDPTNYGTEKDRVNCAFFLKTGACRFGDRCSRQHARPRSSTTLLVPGMYLCGGSLGLSRLMLDEHDQDAILEYDEREIQEHFREFYVDAIEEFQKAGKIVQFKVSCNHEVHLRGNVYVQYSSEEECAAAYKMFNGRWYAQRQLSCELCPVQKWKTAICGLFERRRCPKGKHCNFLHVFRNPGGAFTRADLDLPPSSSSSSMTPAASERTKRDRHSSYWDKGSSSLSRRSTGRRRSHSRERRRREGSSWSERRRKRRRSGDDDDVEDERLLRGSRKQSGSSTNSRRSRRVDQEEDEDRSRTASRRPQERREVLESPSSCPSRDKHRPKRRHGRNSRNSGSRHGRSLSGSLSRSRSRSRHETSDSDSHSRRSRSASPSSRHRRSRSPSREDSSQRSKRGKKHRHHKHHLKHHHHHHHKKKKKRATHSSSPLVQQSHDDAVQPESHDDTVQPESHDDTVQPESHDDTVLPESHDNTVQPESHDAVQPESHNDAESHGPTPQFRDSALVQGNKSKALVVNGRESLYESELVNALPDKGTENPPDVGSPHQV